MLETFANVAQVLGGAAVVAAFVFGVAQMRQFRQQRHDAAAVELMRAMQDTEFTHSLRLLIGLPPAASARELRARGESYEAAALAIGTKFETLGYLVFRGTMPIELVEALVGGTAVDLWARLRLWSNAVREEQNLPLFLEWFQWLAEQMETRGRPRAVPAFTLHRGWRAPAG